MEQREMLINESQNVNFKYVIKVRLGDLSKSKNGWVKQANIIKWNNGLFKLDVRDWNESKQQMRRGITLTRSEAERLVNLLKNIDMRLIDDVEVERTATVAMPVQSSNVQDIKSSGENISDSIDKEDKVSENSPIIESA